MEREIDYRFFTEDFKVKPCSFGAGCNCLLLHPGEKGRRDPRRFFYSSAPCPFYSFNGGSCLYGDGCQFAHGFLERRFHPSSYSYKTLRSLNLKEYLKMQDMLDEFRKKLGQLPTHPADAGERAAIELILGVEAGEPYDTQPVHDCAPVPFYNLTSNDLTMARTASDAICNRYLCTESVTGATFSSINALTLKKYFENAFTLKENVQPILVNCPGPQQGLFNNFYKRSNELFLKHNKDISVTPAGERVKLLSDMLYGPHLLSVVDAPPMTDGSSVPKDPNRGRLRRPIYFDSGATVHVVGDEWMLQGYQVLAEPWQIAVADGHPLVVVGIGSISQEGFMIPNVFHVQGLKMNLISVSQLDRGHGLFSGFHDGVCKVLKRGGHIVGGGFLLANGLYELRFLEVPETETGEEAGSAIQAM